MFVFLFYEHNPMFLTYFFPFDSNTYQELAVLCVCYLEVTKDRSVDLF